MTMITTDKIARAIIGAIAASAFLATGAMAAEPIVGKWKRDNGTIVQYSGSGNTFCGKVKTGKYKGQKFGCMKGSGANYKGTVNVLDEGKTYKGKAKVTGNKMVLSGCFARIFCKSGTLIRQ